MLEDAIAVFDESPLPFFFLFFLVFKNLFPTFIYLFGREGWGGWIFKPDFSIRKAMSLFSYSSEASSETSSESHDPDCYMPWQASCPNQSRTFSPQTKEGRIGAGV